MMRFAQRSCVYRIIGMPSRRLAFLDGGLSMMRLAQEGVFYRIIGMPSRRLADFCAGAVGTAGCGLPHHWHAFRASCIVFCMIC